MQAARPAPSARYARRRFRVAHPIASYAAARASVARTDPGIPEFGELRFPSSHLFRTGRGGQPRYRRSLVLDDNRGADGDAAIEIGHVLIGHAEASGGNRLSDRLGLVGAVDAIERRSQIHRPRAERIVDAARHVARQVGTPSQHLDRRSPARPFLLRGNAVGSTPAEAVAADADAVADRLAVTEHEIEPALGSADVDRPGRVTAGKAHGRARDRARSAGHAGSEETGAAAHDVARDVK